MVFELQVSLIFFADVVLHNLAKNKAILAGITKLFLLFLLTLEANQECLKSYLIFEPKWFGRQRKSNIHGFLTFAFHEFKIITFEVILVKNWPNHCSLFIEWFKKISRHTFEVIFYSCLVWSQKQLKKNQFFLKTETKHRKPNNSNNRECVSSINSRIVWCLKKSE